VPVSRIPTETWYKACCGNNICKACYKENEASIKKQNEEKSAGKKVALTCPFCREKAPTDNEDTLRRLEARAALNDHEAWTVLGDSYRDARYGVSKDEQRALDCFIRAVDLGSARAAATLADYYSNGIAVARHKEKEDVFNRIGALRGYFSSRHNVGRREYHDLGNHEIGIRHWKIAAEAGTQISLDVLEAIYKSDAKKPGKEFISKEDMDRLYRVCYDAQEEVKSEEREKHFQPLDHFKR
jgi:TPR repeat protein